MQHSMQRTAWYSTDQNKGHTQRAAMRMLSFLKARTIWISMEINLLSTDWIVFCASLPHCSYENLHPFYPKHLLVLYLYLTLCFSLQLHLLLTFLRESLLFTCRWLSAYLYLADFIISKTQKNKFILWADAKSIYLLLSSTFTAN